MLGIQYLRKCLGMTAEEFGTLVNVSRSMIAKWESGNQVISKKKALELSEIFECDEVLFSEEISESSMKCLAIVATKYCQKSGFVEEGNNNEDDSWWIEHESRVHRISAKLLNNPELANEVENLLKLYEYSNGEYAVGLMIAVTNLYLTGKEYNLSVGKSDYLKGLIAKDDAVAQIILNALKVGVIRQEDQQNERYKRYGEFFLSKTSK